MSFNLLFQVGCVEGKIAHHNYQGSDEHCEDVNNIYRILLTEHNFDLESKDNERHSMYLLKATCEEEIKYIREVILPEVLN